MFTGAFGVPNLIAQNVILSKWFSGRFLSLSTGLNQSVNNLGIAFSNYFTAKVYEDYRNILAPFFYSAIFCGMSCLTSGIFAMIDLMYEDSLEESKQEELEKLKETGRKEEIDARNRAATYRSRLTLTESESLVVKVENEGILRRFTNEVRSIFAVSKNMRKIEDELNLKEFSEEFNLSSQIEKNLQENSDNLQN